MQMYLLVGVMVLPKTVKITQNMFKAFLFAIALKGFLFAQGFEIKSFQVSASSNILNSDSLILKGAVGTTFNQKSSSDSLTLTGGFSKGLQGVYSEPPLISIETDTSNDVISKEDPVVYTAIATDVNGVLNSTLMIQLGGSEIPIEIPMTVVNDSVFAAEVPESLLTVRNFRAWVVSEDSLLNEAISPYQKPEMQFAKSELSMNNRFSHYKDGIIPKKWRLVSWPGVLDDAKLKNSDLDNGYVFYDWDIQTNKWSEPDTIMPGKAYWFKHRYNKNASFSNHNTTGRAIALEDFDINLVQGWNIIGSPFSFPVGIDYDDQNISDVYLFGDGSKDGWIKSSDQMSPWAGYAVHAMLDNQKITLKPFDDENTSSGRYLVDGWTIKFKLDSDQYLDHSAEIGRRSDAQDGIDKYDIPFLPPMDNFLALRLDNNQDDNYSYSSDFRSDNDLNGIWNLKVLSTEQSKMQLSSILEGSIPSNMHVSLIDIQTRIIHNQYMSKGILIEQLNGSSYDLKLVVGDFNYVTEMTEKTLADIPSEFSLGQNYPNPFNPVTSMKFELPISGRVLLKVHNLMGQEIKTLVDENLSYGYHTARWDGTDNDGRRVASGVYFSELQSSGIRKVRKMVLLK